MKNILKLIFLVPLLFSTPTKSNDFPTQARSEFVFACMSSNQSNRDFMAKCSCAIDEIAKRITSKNTLKLKLLLDFNLGLVLGKKPLKV